VCLILRKSVEQEEEKVGVVVFWGFGVSWIDFERETESQRGSWLQPGHSYLGFFSNHNPGKLLEFGSRLGFFLVQLTLPMISFCGFRCFCFVFSGILFMSIRFFLKLFAEILEFHGCKLR
jgi:hypothetical protein